MSEPDPNDNRERRFGPGNDLRIDLYRALIPQIADEDQRASHVGQTLFWNDPDATWNAGGIYDVWNAIGLQPVWQTLFYVLETLEGEDIAVLESLDTLIDPWECPEEILPDLAASFGYRLKQSLSEEMKRVVVAGLFHAYKSLGQFNGFKVFYRMVGFEVIRIFPLWKKNIIEDRNDYSRTRYDTTPVVAEPVGLAGTQVFATNLSSPPIKPGTVRFSDGGTVVARDLPPSQPPEGLVIVGPTGRLITAAGDAGSINYATGAIQLDLGSPAVGAVTVDYEEITEEWPYHAARLDVEILMNPGGVPIPLTDDEVLGDVLVRMDEVRPIHVLLRAITLAFEIVDQVSPAATDSTACAQILRDVRDPFGIMPGRDYSYLLDQAPFPEDGGLSIEEIVAGTTTVWRQELEDRTGFVCPIKDVLIVDTGGASPADGYY